MTFYFFDLETSGFNCRDDRIMQFAGQRTDMKLNPVGEPDNILVKMTTDVLPEPDAVLVHGITPQKTLSEGITEAEFAKYLTSQVSSADTILVGYNNIRFDNDFIRFTLWRNFHDAYEWSWKDNCSTWDLLDVVRMTRALRPAGIKWAFDSDGKPTNRLEYLSAVNGIDHADSHDALSDVKAALGLAKKIKQKQPKLFDYLLNHRHKNKTAPFVSSAQPIVYTSGRYPSEFHKTTIACMAAELPDKSGALMYDLRIDPDEFSSMGASELAQRWSDRGDKAPYFPVKVLKYNKCPAVAPANVMDKASYERLQLHPQIVDQHFKKLQAVDAFGDKLIKALDLVWPKHQPGLITDPQKVDGSLYDNFVKDDEKIKISAIRAARGDEIEDPGFKDERLKHLVPLYKARNYPKNLNDDERQLWENFRTQKLVTSGRAKKYFSKLEEIAKTPGLDSQKQYLIEELNLYARSILPA